MRALAGLALVAVLALSGMPTPAQETPAKAAPIVSFCEVVRNPASYDGKLITIRAKVSREFEDFTLFDTQCSQKPDVWIWLGGDLQCRTKWEAMDFSCSPGSDVKFRGVEYQMVKDENLETFQKLSSARQNRKPIYRVTAYLNGYILRRESKTRQEAQAHNAGLWPYGMLLSVDCEPSFGSNVKQRRSRSGRGMEEEA